MNCTCLNNVPHADSFPKLNSRIKVINNIIINYLHTKHCLILRGAGQNKSAKRVKWQAKEVLGTTAGKRSKYLATWQAKKY